MIRRPPRSTLDRSSAASDVYKRQVDSIAAYFEVSRDSILTVNEDVIDNAEVSPGDVLEVPPVSGLMYKIKSCLLYTSPSPRDRTRSRMPSSA